jgi:hypothetical protein
MRMGEWNRKLYIGAVQGARPSHNPSLAFGSNRKKEFVAAGPVSRILCAGLLPRDGHSSGPRIAARL